jgi:hypothetical protein
MQGFRSLSVLFDGPNELEWIDFIEVEVGKSSLWDMVSGQTHLNCYMREGFGLMGWGDEQSPEAFCRFA